MSASPTVSNQVIEERKGKRGDERRRDGPELSPVEDKMGEKLGRAWGGALVGQSCSNINNLNVMHQDKSFGLESPMWTLISWVTLIDQINEHIKDNGSRCPTILEESYQKEENYWIGTADISMIKIENIYGEK